MDDEPKARPMLSMTTGCRELAALIERAPDHKMTPAERFEQRVSFVYSGAGEGVTREEVRARLAEEFGDPAQIADQAAAAERAKVVSWLRAGGIYDRLGPAAVAANYRIAHAIEALAHHEGGAS